MTTDTAHVIVGAASPGPRQRRRCGRRASTALVMIGKESERPYERPPLSKDYLLGKADRETIYVHPQEWYAEHDVDLRLGVEVTSIDRTAHE